MDYDLIISRGTVVEGSGLPGFRTDVGVVDGSNATIGDLATEAAQEEIGL